MRNKKLCSFALAILLSSNSAIADELSSETSAGAASQSEALSYASKDDGPWSWNAGYTLTHIHQTDPVTGTVSDNTNQLTGNAEWERDWLLGAGLLLSSTPAEHLTSAGPNFEAGYTWQFDGATRSGAAPKETFHRSIGLRSEIAFLNYKESFSGTTVARTGRAAKPTSGTEQILQTGWTWELDFAPLEWIAFKATYTRYFYNRDVTRFLSLLDTQRAVSFGASGFSNTLNGFQTNESSLEFDFYPAETWELDLEGDRAKSITDGTYTHGVQLKVQKEWGSNWRTGIGFENDNGEGTVQSLGIVMVTYRFN